MFEIQIPFSIKGLPLKPEISGRPKVDEKMIMTLASVMGWDGEGRRLIRCGVGGSLHTIAPTASEITNVLSTGATEDVSFSDQATSEVMIMANKNNSGDTWINIGAVAGVDTGWLLGAGDILILSLNNRQELNLHIISSGDKTIILWTV